MKPLLTRRLRNNMLAAAGVVVLLGAVLMIQASAGPAEWAVPRWVAGDVVHVRNGMDEAAPSYERTLFLDGPFVVRNEQGLERPAYVWRDIETGAPDAAHGVMDLEQGRQISLLPWPIRSDALGLDLEHVTFSGGAGSDGIAIQGLVLRPGLTFTQRDADGTIRHYEVTKLTKREAVVAIALDRPEAPVPVLTGAPARDDLFFELHYTRGAPYPHTVQVSTIGDDGARNHSGTLRTEVVTLADGARPADRSPLVEPPAAPLTHDWPGQHFRVDHVLDSQHVYAAARQDANLTAYLAAHPAAELVDIRYLLMEQADGARTARVWNLTWADPASGDWYSFVRASDGPQEPPVSDLVPGPDPVVERFGTWKTGAWTRAFGGPLPEAAPSVEFAHTKTMFMEMAPGLPEPIALRWTRLVLPDVPNVILHDPLPTALPYATMGVFVGTSQYSVTQSPLQADTYSFGPTSVHASWRHAQTGLWLDLHRAAP